MSSQLFNLKTILEESIEQDSFIKGVLSKKRIKNNEFNKVVFSLKTIKEKLHIQLVYHTDKQTIFKNYDTEQGREKIMDELENTFFQCNLFTKENDYQLLTSKKGKTKLIKSSPSLKNKETSKIHNRQKNDWIQNDELIKVLGLGNENGEIYPRASKKYKQINKYIEIMDGIFKNNPPNSNIRVLDVGCGKGYLTLALYNYLSKKYPIEMRGVDLMENVISWGNETAKKLNFDKLSFIHGDISSINDDNWDALIALHACDIATDLAIAKGIHSKAKYIMVAPCCQKQVRKSMTPPKKWNSILKHGIQLEKQAVLLTDAMRALILEYFGYKTKVFEFIESEHTPKNTMIVAEFCGQENHESLSTFNALKVEFGIEFHYLERLLKW